MPSTTSGESRTDFDRPLAAFLDHPDLPLADVLTSAHVRQACTKHSVVFGVARNVIFTPCLTLWAMLSSVVSIDKACAAACVQVSVLLLALSRPKWSEDTGVFCRARSRMPAPFVQELTETLADRLEQAALPHCGMACAPTWATARSSCCPTASRIRLPFRNMPTRRKGWARP